MTISEIQLDKDGIVVWTEGSDDFYITAKDFDKVKKAMKDWQKEYGK